MIAVVGATHFDDEDDEFGGRINGVDISGDVAVVGSEFEQTDAANLNSLNSAGAAYIINYTGISTWSNDQKLVPSSTRELGARFGASVAISGDYCVVGAPYEDVNSGHTNDGAAYVFEYNSSTGNWDQVARLFDTDAEDDDLFGYSVGISGDILIVGAPYQDYDANGLNFKEDAGAVYMYERIAGTWTLANKVVSNDRDDDDHFGWDVDFNSSYALVGAPDEDDDVNGNNQELGAGSAYLIKKSSGNYSQHQKIVPSDRDDGDRFGYSVGITSNYLIVGADLDEDDESGTDALSDAGSAYLFELDGTSWVQDDKIDGENREEGNRFGSSVDIDGTNAIVGEFSDDTDAGGGNSKTNAGTADIFKRNSSSTNWDSENKIDASDRAKDDEFGWSVALNGDYAIVGAPNWNSGADLNAGKAYFFALCEDPVITNQPEDNYCVTSWPVTLSVTANGVNHGISYDWYKIGNSNSITSSSTLQRTSTQQGDYYVDVTINGCELTKTSNTVTVSSGPEPGLNCSESRIGILRENNFNIYPNPVHQKLSVTGKNLISAKIYDQMGKEIIVSSINTSELIKINTLHLAQGVYILEIGSDLGIERRKISIQH